MESSNPSILFMGTPFFAAKALEALSEAGFNLIGVVTRPDSSKGRSGVRSPSDVKTEAIDLNLPVFQPENKKELTEIVDKLKPELVVIAAYGMLVPAEVLDVPKFGTLNIHGSLLPKYRGASPITEAIINGDEETGITIMTVSVGMDEGDIITKYELNIEGKDTTETLTEKMSELGARGIVETIPGWVSGELKATPQDDSLATYCRKVTKENGHIDWNMSEEQIERMIRAYNPWPSAYTFAEKHRIKILKAAVVHSRHSREGGNPDPIGVLEFEDGHIYVGTSKGTLEILELQPEGKKSMTASDFINGNRELDGIKLT